MNKKFMPCLEYIALVKIATTLWNQKNIRALIKGDSGSRLEWLQIEAKVRAKVPLLLLPQPLKEEMLNIIKPIGREICDWIDFNRKIYDLAVNLPNELTWTPQGTLDVKETTRALMKRETIDIKERYKLACIYCLKNDVEALWKKMSLNLRKLFYNEEHPRNITQSKLVVFWTYYIKGEVSKMADMIRRDNGERSTPYQWAFELAVKDINQVAVEYFWNKLTSEERELSPRILNFLNSPDIKIFYFVQFNEEQQRNVFEKCPFGVLMSFLFSPWQELFMIMTNHVDVFLKNSEYYRLLLAIVGRQKEGFKDYDYRKLFKEFWLKSDITRKKYVINKNAKKRKRNLLLQLFLIKDMKNISLLLKYATIEESQNILYIVSSYICKILSCREKLDMIKFFLSEFIYSGEELVEFIDTCKRNKLPFDEEFFLLLDKLIQE